MKIDVGCRFDYLGEAETPAVVLVEPHTDLGDALLSARWDPQPAESFTDIYGNVCARFVLPPDVSAFSYHATVEVSPEAEDSPGEWLPHARIEDLPAEQLQWLLPSRFCESDVLGDRAWELFGETPPTAARVQAVCDWIHEHITYGVASIPTTTAAEILELRGGMCRDFAHLGVTFCRALGIPARYVGGYLPDIGIPGPFPPMDFHAWFEVWLGDRWWTFDARFNEPRIGRVPVGRGRDAADTAMVTTYGAATLVRMNVWADETETAADAH